MNNNDAIEFTGNSYIVKNSELPSVEEIIHFLGSDCGALLIKLTREYENKDWSDYAQGKKEGILEAYRLLNKYEDNLRNRNQKLQTDEELFEYLENKYPVGSELKIGPIYYEMSDSYRTNYNFEMVIKNASSRGYTFVYFDLEHMKQIDEWLDGQK